MDVRKLVKSGYSSLVVALPKEWIKNNKLKGGDQVFIEDENNVLLVKREYKKKPIDKNEKVIDVDGKSDRVLYRDITSSYLNNYYYVILKGKSIKEKSGILKKMISDLIAFEVVDESSERIVVKNFLNIYDSELKLLMRRMDNVVRSMMIDAKSAVQDPKIVESIVDRDKEVNRLNALISKILKAAHTDKSILNIVGITELEILSYWEMNGVIEKVGDRVKHIARVIPELKPANKKDFLKLFVMIETYYLNSMAAFYNNSIRQSDAICEQKEVIGKEIQDFASHNCVACSKIATNSFNINGHINDIGRIVRYIASE